MSLKPLSAFVALSFTIVPAAARAEPDKAACVTAATRGQVLRDEGKLRESRVQLAVCAQAACPTVVRSSCTEWLADVDARMPTVTMHATLDDRLVSDVRVSIDGQPLVPSPAAQPVQVDPGAHTFQYVLGDQQITEKVVLHEREKNVALAPRFVTPQPAPSASPGAHPPLDSAAVATESRPVPLGVWVLGGVGVVGLGSFAYFGWSADKKLSDLRSTCAPQCSAADKDSAHTQAVIADVSLGVGAAALVAAGIWYFARPTVKSSGPTVGASVGPGSASLGVTGTF